jgi:hypothetical protein
MIVFVFTEHLHTNLKVKLGSAKTIIVVYFNYKQPKTGLPFKLAHLVV